MTDRVRTAADPPLVSAIPIVLQEDTFLDHASIMDKAPARTASGRPWNVPTFCGCRFPLVDNRASVDIIVYGLFSASAYRGAADKSMPIVLPHWLVSSIFSVSLFIRRTFRSK
jgi:hypothetical protein